MVQIACDNPEIEKALEKLHLIPPKQCKSSAQIMETLNAAYKYARENKVHKISIDMNSDAGSFHCSGESS